MFSIYRRFDTTNNNFINMAKQTTIGSTEPVDLSKGCQIVALTMLQTLANEGCISKETHGALMGLLKEMRLPTEAEIKEVIEGRWRDAVLDAVRSGQEFHLPVPKPGQAGVFDLVPYKVVPA